MLCESAHIGKLACTYAQMFIHVQELLTAFNIYEKQGWPKFNCGSTGSYFHVPPAQSAMPIPGYSERISLKFPLLPPPGALDL